MQGFWDAAAGLLLEHPFPIAARLILFAAVPIVFPSVIVTLPPTTSGPLSTEDEFSRQRFPETSSGELIATVCWIVMSHVFPVPRE